MCTNTIFSGRKAVRVAGDKCGEMNPHLASPGTIQAIVYEQNRNNNLDIDKQKKKQKKQKSFDIYRQQMFKKNTIILAYAILVILKSFVSIFEIFTISHKNTIFLFCLTNVDPA